MKRAIIFVLCVAPMVGLYYAIRWIMFAAPGSFGDGFFLGVLTVICLLVAVEKAGLYGMYDLRHGYWTPYRD